MPTPLAIAKERITSTKKAVADATGALDRKKNECKTLTAAAEKLDTDLKALTEKKKAADDAAKACDDRVKELTKVKEFADADAEIAKLELELEEARALRAALPPDAAADIDEADKAIEAASDALTGKKAELGYDALKAKNDAAAAAIEAAVKKAKEDAEKAAKKAQLEAARKQLQADIANRMKEKNDLYARVSTTNDALAELKKNEQKIADEIAAIP